MIEAIQALREEHRLLIGFSREIHQAWDRPFPVGRVLSREILALFWKLSEDIHHEKEENGLLPLLAKASLPFELGPIAIVLAEHVSGRQFLEEMLRLSAGDAAWAPDDLKEMVRHSESVRNLLQAHVNREEHLLFPQAEKSLPYEMGAELIHLFRGIDLKWGRTDIVNRLRSLLQA